MQPSADLGHGFLYVFWLVSEFITKWTPAIVSEVIGTAPAGGSATSTISIGTISQPVSATQVVDYLHGMVTPIMYQHAYQYWLYFVAASLAFSLLFAAGIIYNVIQVRAIRAAEYKYFAAMAKPVSQGGPAHVHKRWDHVMDQLSSGTEQGWRVAILEADIMLKDLLDSLGYRGETLADQMRQVNRGDFKSIDLAWEAHRARNRVAHTQGGGIDQHEARRVIGLYAQVFKEFEFLE